MIKLQSQSAAKTTEMKSTYIYGYKIFEDGTIISRKTGKPFKPYDNGKGYLIVGISVDGKRKTKAIHRLLGEAFLENPNNYSDVDHIDGDRRNNNLSNLRWICHGGNIKNSYDNKNRCAKGINNIMCKTLEKDVHKICELLEKGHKASEIRDFGFSYSVTRKIKSKENWVHISCTYSF